MVIDRDTFAHVVKGFKVYPNLAHMRCETMDEYKALVTDAYGGDMTDVEFITLEEGTELVLSSDRHYYTRTPK